MVVSTMDDIVSRLSAPMLNDPVTPISLNSRFYELQMAEIFGVDISSPDSIGAMADDASLLELAPYFPYFWTPYKLRTGEHRQIGDEITNMLSKYKDLKGPCSMRVTSSEELQHHLLVMYTIAWAHYVLGKRHMDGVLFHEPEEDGHLPREFPEGFCGETSSSFFYSLARLGYANVGRAACSGKDHDYIILPFVIEEQEICGCIVGDATSDQLWFPGRVVRNNVFIVFGNEWEYLTDNNGFRLRTAIQWNRDHTRWRFWSSYAEEMTRTQGDNFPDRVYYLGSMRDPRLDDGRLRKRWGDLTVESYGTQPFKRTLIDPEETVQNFFRLAFSNPVDISQWAE